MGLEGHFDSCMFVCMTFLKLLHAFVYDFLLLVLHELGMIFLWVCICCVCLSYGGYNVCAKVDVRGLP